MKRPGDDDFVCLPVKLDLLTELPEKRLPVFIVPALEDRGELVAPNAADRAVVKDLADQAAGADDHFSAAYCLSGTLIVTAVPHSGLGRMSRLPEHMSFRRWRIMIIARRRQVQKKTENTAAGRPVGACLSPQCAL